MLIRDCMQLCSSYGSPEGNLPYQQAPTPVVSSQTFAPRFQPGAKNFEKKGDAQGVRPAHLLFFDCCRLYFLR